MKLLHDIAVASFFLSVLAACGGRDVTVTSAAVADAGPADAGSGDAGAPDAGFAPSAYCAAQGRISGEIEIIPAPRSVLQWGEKRPVSTGSLSANGMTAADEAELRSIADLTGYTFTVGTGGIHVELHPDAEWGALAAACGFEKPETGGAYYLRTAAASDRAVVDIFAGEASGRLYALKSLLQLMQTGGPTIREVALYDRPESPVRGVIEGFYGTPWDKDKRLDILGHLAALKLNYYVYAPKNDVWITALWRQDFPLDEVKNIRAVADEAKKNRIRACWELLPGGGVIFSRQEDLDQLMKKYRVIAAQGIDCFILAFDDVNKTLYAEDVQVYATYTEGQVAFANRVAEALIALSPGAMLGFVPNEYYSEHPDAKTDLAYIGEHLDPRWAVAWTGPQVGSKTITAADADWITGIIRRPPFLGDNYPVSDNPQKSGVVNLGPLTGRDPTLPDKVSGFIFNAMPYPYASLPGVATGADFVWNPAGYQPLVSLKNASRLLAGEAAGPALEALCLADRSTMLEPSVAPELDAAVAAFWAAWDSGAGITTAADALRAGFFETYAVLPANLAGEHVLRPLMEELKPWIEKLATYGEAGDIALELLTYKKAGSAIDPARLAELQHLAGDAASHNEKPTGKTMDDFLSRVIAILNQ